MANSTIATTISLKETDKVVLLTLDPGLTNAGWVVSEYNLQTKKLHVIAVGLIHGNNYAELKAQEEAVSIYGKRMVSLAAIRSGFTSIYEEFKPDFVASENAFFNRFRPAAFVALNDFIGTIRSVLYHRFDQPLYLISPKSIKRAVCIGDAKKQDIANSVRNHPNISFSMNNIPDVEHIWDAVGGAYAFTKLYLDKVIKNESYDNVISSQKVKK